MQIVLYIKKQVLSLIVLYYVKVNPAEFSSTEATKVCMDLKSKME